jgi:hypothetical protein
MLNTARQWIVATNARYWGALPLQARRLIRLQGALLTSALLVALAVANVVVHQGYETHAFAKPALPSEHWDNHVRDFGDKVSRAFGVRVQTANEFADWILEASVRQQLDPDLLASLVLTESSFRKDVRSHVGAIGPAQVRPDYWGRFCGANDLTDPEQNIYCGAQVLAHLKEVCGGDSCALAAYNTGINSERKQAGRRYVSKIDYHRSKLETL